MKLWQIIEVGKYQIIVRWNRLRKIFGRFRKNRHQLTSTTSYGRYPELFTELKNNLRERLKQKNPAVLSYGCSTGEECFTLRSYLPEAFIVGTDISEFNLLQARSKNTDDRIEFVYSNEKNITASGPYDAICCLSVLCRWTDTEHVEDSSNIYPFARFDDAVSFLSEQVKPGGLLVIYNSNFRFEDSSVYKHFEAIDTPSLKDSGFVHKFNRNNKKIREPHRTVIYKKVDV
jgi:hypothetical protein